MTATVMTANVELPGQLLLECAHAYRLGQEAKAAANWHQCLELLEQLLPQLTNLTEFNQLLPHMLAAQERQDFLGLADDIEYELQPLIAGLAPQHNRT